MIAEVKEDLTAEQTFESKKCKLAELGNALLTDPESNIKLLKEMVQLSKDNDHTIVKLGLLSLLAVFKDIVPGYCLIVIYYNAQFICNDIMIILALKININPIFNVAVIGSGFLLKRN
ncbi:hypothetical protein V8G54_023494 [Vigna mungo]|uniref:Nucleolar complex-associated protein 3 N-terminal domain-containing protein n=1 Tax=Vigna mungo TaxID=3915 RepID=A0AAQ3RRM9_VIGMU